MFKAITINTADTAEPHITAADDAALYQGLAGISGILKTGSDMQAVVTDSNTIQIGDGVVIANGRYGRIAAGDNVTFSIRSGVAGQKRNDLIVVRYEVDSDGVTELMSLKLVEGISGTAAADPEVSDDDVILYRIKAEGHSVTVERVAPLIQGLQLVSQDIGNVDKKLGNVTGMKVGTTIVHVPTNNEPYIKFLSGITGLPTIIAGNGDGGANSARITGVTLQGGDAYAIFQPGSAQTGGLRINYAIIY